MSYKYTVSIPRAKTVGGEGDTTPPVESYDLGPKIRAAIACGVFVSLFACVLWSALTLSPDSWQTWAKGMIGVVGLGILVTCALGFWWSFVAAYRAWRVDDKARTRRYKHEDAQIRAQKALAKAAEDGITRGNDLDGNPLTFTDQQRLDFIALKMLGRVYLYGQPATRDAMTRDGVCTQEEWNLINAGMKALGLRQKQTWQDSDFGSAWAIWDENVRLETHDGDRYLMVSKQNGQWHALERIE